MTNTIVARRYAEALFTIAGRQGAEARDKYGACLAQLASLVNEDPRFAEMLRSPVFSIAEKKAVLGSILDRLDAGQTMRSFCNLLADKERLGILRDIAAWYGILLDAARGVLRGKVITAIVLSPEKQTALRQALEKKSGHDMELAFEVDPEILGGLVLAVGDKVLDTSLRAQLGNMREILKRGAYAD